MMRGDLDVATSLWSARKAISSPVETCSTWMRARCSRAMETRRFVQISAVICVAPDRMRGGVAGDALVHAGVEAEFVLAVEGGATARVAQDFGHAGVVGDQQRAGRGAHEHLDAGRARQALQFGDMSSRFHGCRRHRRRNRNASATSRAKPFRPAPRASWSADWCWAFRTRPSRRRARRPASRFRDLPCGSGRARGNEPGCRSRPAGCAGPCNRRLARRWLDDRSPMAAMVSPITPTSRARDAVLVDQHAAAQDQIVSVLRHGASELFGELRTKACMDALV